VLREHAPDFLLQGIVAPGTGRPPRGIAPLRCPLAVGGWGDRQNPADRLDPILLAMLADEAGHRLNGRSSSAWAKYADALRRISFACRSSRFSRSSAFSRSASSVGTPARLPLSTSAFLTHSSSV